MLVLLLVIGYFIPLGVAVARKHNITGVAIISLLLGWTVVGWIIALVMACGADHQQTVIVNQAPVARFDPYTGQPLPSGDQAALPAPPAPAAD